jgi:hypothetical protein
MLSLLLARKMLNLSSELHHLDAIKRRVFLELQRELPKISGASVPPH